MPARAAMARSVAPSKPRSRNSSRAAWRMRSRLRRPRRSRPTSGRRSAGRAADGDVGAVGAIDSDRVAESERVPNRSSGAASRTPHQHVPSHRAAERAKARLNPAGPSNAVEPLPRLPARSRRLDHGGRSLAPHAASLTASESFSRRTGRRCTGRGRPARARTGASAGPPARRPVRRPWDAIIAASAPSAQEVGIPGHTTARPKKTSMPSRSIPDG